MKTSWLKLGAFVLIAALIAIAGKIVTTTSFFSDTETSSSNIFAVSECFGSIGTTWADKVVDENQGTLKNGSPITDPNRTDPSKTLGPNDWTSGGSTGFFSLGEGGTITLSFINPVYNQAGADLEIYEATNGRNSYPLEKAKVEVSKNGTDWSNAGEATSEPTGDGVTQISIPEPLPSIKYVRLTDTTDFALHASNADGFDLDAVRAIYGCVVEER